MIRDLMTWFRIRLGFIRFRIRPLIKKTGYGSNLREKSGPVSASVRWVNKPGYSREKKTGSDPRKENRYLDSTYFLPYKIDLLVFSFDICKNQYDWYLITVLSLWSINAERKITFQMDFKPWSCSDRIRQIFENRIRIRLYLIIGSGSD